MKNTTANSTIALTSAFMLTIILHEIAHYLVALVLDIGPVLFHNRVEYASSASASDHMWIAAAGPIFSLIQGLLAFAFVSKMKTSMSSLFVLWFAIAGLITFFGYMMIAPIIPFGDTGKVFHILNVPMFVQITVSVLAVILITIILMKTTAHFERFATEDFGSIKENRKKWSIALILVPLLISIVFITALQFPIPHVASILATTCGPFSIMAVFGTFIGKKERLKIDSLGSSINKRFSFALILLLVCIVLINRLLVQGI